MYNYSCNFEFRNRLQKINPFRAIFWASSLAPRYSLHRLRELASSSTFPFVDFWLFSLVICFSQSALVIWQIRHGPNMFGLVYYPVSQSRFKFWLIKNIWFKILRLYHEILTNQIAWFSLEFLSQKWAPRIELGY